MQNLVKFIPFILKILSGNKILTKVKSHNSDNNRWILSLIKLVLCFIIIYLCMFYESNKAMHSKYITQKSFYLQRSRAITLTIIGRFYLWSNLTGPVFYDYIPVYEIWIQYIKVFKRYCPETIFIMEIKIYNSDNNQWILFIIRLDLYFMIIYLFMKFESNAPMYSKDIARKPFFRRRSRAITHNNWWILSVIKLYFMII